MTDLSTRALLLSLSISQWEGRRFDKQITAEVNNQHGAAADAGRFNKALIEPKAMLGIGRVVNAARSGFIDRTLPWMNDGSRIANAADYLDITNWLRTKRSEFETEVEAFLAQYPTLVQQSAGRLSGMFKDSDYPSVPELRRKFSMTMNVMQVPNVADFRIDISDAQAEELRREISATMTSASDIALQDIVRRVSDVTERMVERMAAYKPGQPGVRAEGTFKDSLVTNVRDLVKQLPNFNLTADPRIDAMVSKLDAMAAHDPDVLRGNESARKDAADKAQEILNTIGAYFA